MNEEKRKEMREAAHQYRERGWSIIPVGRDKRPLLKTWKQYQSEHASHEQIDAWFTQYPDMNIGVVTGAISGIAVVDVEAGGSTAGFPPTVVARTGGGGWHLYYKHPGKKVKNATRITALTDIRGDGGFVVAPPSVSDKGSYSWTLSPEDTAMADYPVHVFKNDGKESVSATQESSWKNLLNEDVHEGKRNDSAARVAGGLINQFPDPEQAVQKALPLLKQWNQEHCKPPLDEQELIEVFNSILWKDQSSSIRTKLDHMKGELAAMGADGSESPQKQLILDLVLKAKDIELFRDEYQEAYVRVMVNGHKEIWSCRGRKFRMWIAQRFFEAHGALAENGSITTALQIIEAKAVFKGDEHKLYNRVAPAGDAILYDLADKQNRAVRITASGWEVVNDPPTMFRRHQHQLAQVAPEPGGNVSDLLKFVNVTEPGQQILLLVYLVTCYITGFPHPILYVHGQQGSAKSTLSKLLRKLVDPSMVEALSMPNNANELALQLSRHHLVFYENVSRIPNNVSDMLCVAVTGGGISKRMLYTDADDFILNIQTNVGINGINISAIQPDLLERSILMELKRVSDDNRVTEKELYAAFEQAKPKILGAIFDAVSKALRIAPTIQLDEKTRMADFLVWGCAIAEALGHPRDEFLAAYKQSVETQSDEALYASPEAETLMKFMSSRNFFEGTPQELLRELHKVVQGDYDYVPRYFPSKPNALMRRLNTLKPNLLSIGIKIIEFKSRGVRGVRVERVGEKTAQIVQNAHKPQETLFSKKKADDVVDPDDVPF